MKQLETMEIPCVLQVVFCEFTNKKPVSCFILKRFKKSDIRSSFCIFFFQQLAFLSIDTLLLGMTSVRVN